MTLLRLRRAGIGLVVWTLALLAACAKGPSTTRPTDAGVSMDAAVDDAAIGADSGAEDAAVDAPTGYDAGEAFDAGEPSDAGGDVDAGAALDAGATGPVACTPANAATTCGGRPCVDGFCCDDACGGACRACDVAGAEGRCTIHAAGTDPDLECADQAASTCGTTGTCSASGACSFHPSGTGCDDGQPCTTSDECDGAGTCRGDAPTSCTVGAGNECCLASCGTSGCQTAAGACSDVCGASRLEVGRTCGGCGAAGASGLCQGGAVHPCDASNHDLCRAVTCGGASFYCTNQGGSWAWRSAATCDDGNACTHTDRCGAGTCAGTTIACTSTACSTRSCNGTATCTSSPNVGASCDDGDACTYGDACGASGTCSAGTRVTCTSTACVDRTCNGTASCAQTVRTGATCSDGNACTHGETCDSGGTCGGGATLSCDAQDTTCMDWSCNGTATCASAPRNVGGACDDGNPVTSPDRCTATGTCEEVAGCTVPAGACATGSQTRDGCANARVIGRSVAGTGGFSTSPTSCSAMDRHDGSGCADSGFDHSYRLWMRAGETASIRLRTGSGCSGGTWYGTLQIFAGATCTDTTCATRKHCDDTETDVTRNYTATADGWITIVADGSSDGEAGTYTLTVGLTCGTSDCGC